LTLRTFSRSGNISLAILNSEVTGEITENNILEGLLWSYWREVISVPAFVLII
jgi:hypothetical protein